MKYILPIESNKIKTVSMEDSIDMSVLNFPENIFNKEKAALLFLRNTGIKTNFDFTDCTYEQKETYLMLFMTGRRVDVAMPILASTWVRILIHNKFESTIESILTEEEISKFYEDHKDLINEIHRFLISIPLCAIDVFNNGRTKSNKEPINPGAVWMKTDYDEMNPFTLIQIFDFYDTIILAQNLEGSYEPIFYTNYFESCHDEHYPGFIKDLMNKFPYLSLLNVLYNDNEDVINKFTDGLKEILSE